MAADDNEPTLVMKDRSKGFTPDNSVMVSKRAARVIEQYTKAEMQDMILAGEPPDCCTLQELIRIEKFVEG
jgi:hypothetical protein